MAEFAARWTDALACAPDRTPAGELYRGRAFATARAAACAAGAPIAAISAGLGLVNGMTAIPCYSLSATSGDDGLVSLVTDFEPSAWWRLARSGPFSSEIGATVRGASVALFALSRPYAAMISEDLEELADQVETMRIFGLGLERVLPSAVRPALMPYDEGSDAAIGRGTRGDFCARALAFHVGRTPAGGDLEEARRTARDAAGPAPVRPARQTVSDEQVAAMIRRARREGARGCSVRAVRNAGLACGSARFERIRAKVAEDA